MTSATNASTLRNRAIRRGFSLLELILVLMLSVVILAVYVSAMDEAEAASEFLKDSSVPGIGRTQLLGTPRDAPAMGAMADGNESQPIDPESDPNMLLSSPHGDIPDLGPDSLEPPQQPRQ